MRFVRLCAVSCLAIISSTAAEAACNSGDIVGSWVLTTVPSSGWWMKCELAIGQDGRLSNSSKCSRRGKSDIQVTGTIQSNSSCQVVGAFVLGNQQFRLVDANLNIDQSLVAGIATLGRSFFQFQALKR